MYTFDINSISVSFPISAIKSRLCFHWDSSWEVFDWLVPSRLLTTYIQRAMGVRWERRVRWVGRKLCRVLYQDTWQRVRVFEASMCLLEWLRLKKCPILRIVCRCSPTASKCWCACIVSVLIRRSSCISLNSLVSQTSLFCLYGFLLPTQRIIIFFVFPCTTWGTELPHPECIYFASFWVAPRLVDIVTDQIEILVFLNHTKLLDLWVSINFAQSSFHPLVDIKIL